MFGGKRTGLSSLFASGSGFGTVTSAGLFGAAGTNVGGLFGASSRKSFLISDYSIGLKQLTSIGKHNKAFWGQTQAGTMVTFNPPSGTYTLEENGVLTNINTKYQCITAMKEYENKSLEELRMEDYTAYRKHKQAEAAPCFGYGIPAVKTKAGFYSRHNQPPGFGTSSFWGQTQAGTTVTFNPPSGTYTLEENGVPTNINTKYQCITAMKEYENKSLEELRMEDYTAYRKHKQAEAATWFGYGIPAAKTQAGFYSRHNQPSGFGTSSFDGQVQAGTVLKLNPPSGTDTIVKNGVSKKISTKHHCVTAMKEYENKSLEELRLEDYTVNRKGNQAGTATGFGFGTLTAPMQAGFYFWQNKPIGFGTSTFCCQAQAGTVLKLKTPSGTDRMVKNGVSTSIVTKHHCVTAMKEYENKSLEPFGRKCVWRTTQLTGRATKQEQPLDSVLAPPLQRCKQASLLGRTSPLALERQRFAVKPRPVRW